MAERKLSRIRANVWRVAVMRSGLLTALVLAILLGALILVVKERGKGNLHRLQVELQSKPEQQGPPVALPGGQEAIVLKRVFTTGGMVPEFVSATLLPGRGMNMLQITASIPARGEISLLASPSVDEAAKRLSGTGEDAAGLASLGLGGAFEVPWADRLGGVPTPDGEDVMSVWQGQTLILPGAPRLSGMASSALGGLMLKRAADSIDTHVLPDGWQSKSVYNAGGFDGHWLSQTEVTTLVLLTGRVVEISVVARNTGPVPEPMSIGWHPRFAIPSGERASATLRLPSSNRVEIRPSGTGAGLPTGKVLSTDGSEYDFSRQPGKLLGKQALSETYVHLKQGALDVGPVVELRDVAGEFGLRMTLLTPSIKAIRVDAPASEPIITIAPQFNLSDPFGKEWPKDEDTGMAVLQPGQSAQWKVRLELFPIVKQNGSHL